jgi:hypothetical protein
VPAYLAVALLCMSIAAGVYFFRGNPPHWSARRCRMLGGCCLLLTLLACLYLTLILLLLGRVSAA